MTTPIATAYVDILPSTANFGPALSRQVTESLNGVKAKAKETGNAIAEGIHAGTSKAAHDVGYFRETAVEAFGEIKSAIAGLVAFEGLKKLSESFLGAGEAMEHLEDRIAVGTGAAGANLEGLVEAAKTLAKEIPNSFADIGGAVTQVSQRLGLTGKPLEETAARFLNISRVTKEQLSIPETTKALAAFGVEAKDQGEVLEQLFAASQRSGVTISALVSGLATGAPVLTQFGFDAARSADLLSSLDKAGVSADKTTAGLRIAFSRFAKAGLEPQKALLGVVGQMEEFIRTGNDPRAGLIAGKIFGTRGAAAFTAAVKSGALSVETLTADAEEVGTPIEDAADRTIHFGEQMSILKHQISEAVGPKAVQFLEFLTEKVEELRVEFASPEFQEFASQLGDAAETVAPVLAEIADTFIAAAAAAADFASTGVGKELLKVAAALAAIAAARAAVGVLAGVGASLAGIAVGGGAASAASLGLVAKNLVKIGALIFVLDKLNDAANKAAGTTGGLVTRLGEGLADIKGLAGDAYDGILNATQGAADGVSKVINAIPGLHIDTSEFDARIDADTARVIGLHETLGALPKQIHTDYTLTINTKFTSGGQHAPGSAQSLANEFTAEKTGALGKARAEAAAKHAADAAAKEPNAAPFDYEKYVSNLLKKIAAAGGSASGGGTGGAAHRAATSAAETAAKAAARAVAAALKAAGKQISARTFVESITGTPEKIKAAFDKLLASLKAANQPALAAFAKGVEHDLLGDANKRDSLSARFRGVVYSLDELVAKVKDLKRESADFAAGVKNSIIGPGSVAEASKGIGTTFTGIRNNLRAAILDASAFSKAIATLQRLRLNNTSLRQLVEAGPEAGLAAAQAIARQGASGVGVINDLQTRLTAKGKDLGSSVAKTFYGAGISAAEGLVKGLQSQEAKLDATMNAIADRMVAHLKRALGIHSRSEVFFQAGLQVPAGLAGGVRAGAPSVAAASSSLSNSVVFGAGAVQVHGVSDPARAREVGTVIGQGVADLLARNATRAALAGA